MKKNEEINKHNEEFGLIGRWDGDFTGLVVTTLEDALARKRKGDVERKKRMEERKRIADKKASDQDRSE